MEKIMHGIEVKEKSTKERFSELDHQEIIDDHRGTVLG